jgi:hypothetical protein
LADRLGGADPGQDAEVVRVHDRPSRLIDGRAGFAEFLAGGLPVGVGLRDLQGVQVRAAELLGMSFRSFRYYAKKYNLK